MITDFLGLVFVCKLDAKNVYISKRGLKYFVESRSGELVDCEDEYILNRLHLIIDNIENVLTNYDLFEKMNDRLYFSKDFLKPIEPSIRIVLENVKGHFEIVTMHYKKTKNTTQ